MPGCDFAHAQDGLNLLILLMFKDNISLDSAHLIYVAKFGRFVLSMKERLRLKRRCCLVGTPFIVVKSRSGTGYRKLMFKGRDQNLMSDEVCLFSRT